MDEEFQFDPEAFIKDEEIPEIPAGTLRPTTYGPGSPNPTPADKREFVGNADNPLQQGDVALQPHIAAEYGLKTGDPFKYEGKTYNYADTPAARVGPVIDVYYPKKGFDPNAFIEGKEPPSPSMVATTQPDTMPKVAFDPHAFLEPAPAEEATTEEEGLGKAIGKGLKKFGEAIGKPVNVPEAQISTHPYPTQPIETQPVQMGLGQPIQQTPIPQSVAGGAPPPPAAPSPLPPPPDYGPPNPQLEGARQAFAGMIPTSMEQVQAMVTLPRPSQTIGEADAQWGAAVRGELGPVEQSKAIVSTGIQVSPLAKLGEIAGAGAATIRMSREIPGAIAGTAPPAGRQIPAPVKSAPQGKIVPPPQTHYAGGATTAPVQAPTGKPIAAPPGAVAAPPAGVPPPPPPGQPPGGTGPIPPQPPKSVPQAMGFKQIVRRIAAKFDSVFTRADYDARQKANDLRQDFGAELKGKADSKANELARKDMEAYSFIFEAQGIKSNLVTDAALIKASKNSKLSSKYGPIIQYAIDNFDRLSKIQNRYGKLMADQLAEDRAAGIEYGERQGYVTHVLKNEPEKSLVSFFTGGRTGSGIGRYFSKSRTFNTLAEAINAGFDPASVNLADLAQHRIAASRRLILQKALFNELKNIAGPDGRPVVAQIGRGTDTPRGYDQIRANGVDLAVHPDYAPIFKALYGDSALRRSSKARAFMKFVGVEKAFTLAVDTFHGFRGIQKNMFYGGKGSRLGYDPGVTVYELSNEALDKEVASGTITRDQAGWAKKARPHVEAMMNEGLNVSRYADNLVQQLHISFPGTRGINDWIFKRVFRGATIQASHANYLRNRARFPELTDQQVATKTAREMNEVFGNMMNQGLIKDKTIRDMANITVLAPQWVESQVRAEFRGYGQMGKIIPDALRGKFRVGVVAQGQATSVLAYLVGNQIINYLTTGHSTFGNPEGHRLDAWIPVGKRGLYLDPLALGAEYVDKFIDVMHRQGENGTVASVASEMAKTKLSRIGHAVVTLVTQRDWRGRRLHGSEIYKTALTDLIPMPIFASSTIQTDPKSPTGYTFNPQAERIAQQLVQSAGLRAQLGYPPDEGPQVPLRPHVVQTIPLRSRAVHTIPARR